MDLLHITVVLNYSEKSLKYAPAKEIFAALGGRVKEKEKRPREPAARMRDDNKKTLIIWGFDKCIITIEGITNIDNYIENIMGYFETINKTVPFGEIANIEVTTNWMIPVHNHNFKWLERTYRKAFLATHKNIMNGVFDSSIILDLDTEDGFLHHQSGAMEKQQLLDDYIVFDLQGAPKVLIFLWASIYDDKLINYEYDEIRSHILRLFARCKAHSDEFGKILEGMI